MVKSEIELRTELLVVSPSLADPALRTAGLAWLTMVLELAEQEVFSELNLRWQRNLDGTKNTLVISLDSSKNYRTRNLLSLPDAPAVIYRRRERLDEAVARLLSRTTPEALWGALAGQRLASLGAWEFINAWSRKMRGSSAAPRYPRYLDAQDFLLSVLDLFDERSHPWL